MALLKAAARSLGRFLDYALSFRATGGEREFAAEFRRFWGSPPAPRAGWMLVELPGNPVIALCNASFARIVSDARDARPVFFAHRIHGQAQLRMARAICPDAVFAWLDSPRYYGLRLRALARAWTAWRGLKSPEDVLAWQCDGMKFGDVIYDNTLLFGYATLRRVDWKVLAVLWSFFVHRGIIRDLMRRHRFETSVLSHTIGIVGGTFSRYLLRDGIEVLNRVGSHEILVKKYRSFADVGVYPWRPERHYFDHMMRLPDDVVLPLARQYLDQRHDNAVRQIAVDIAFSRDKRVYQSAREFCREHGLDPGRKTVFVMLHGFNDHPHSHFARPLMFQDYYDWMERTVETAVENESVNWVIKEHPAAHLYVTRDVNLDERFRRLGKRHIVFLDSRADFNALSIRHVAHAIVTCLGTAGMEYACLGIPCVLAGESPYSGFGFTLEAETREEYRRLLLDIGNLPPLSPEQRKAALVVLFFLMPLQHSERFHFCPRYDIATMLASASIRPDALLRDAAAALRATPRAELDRLIRDLSAFARDPGYTQYVNLHQYPFMAPAAGRAGSP